MKQILNCWFAKFGLDMEEIYPVYQVTQMWDRLEVNLKKEIMRVNLELMSWAVYCITGHWAIKYKNYWAKKSLVLTIWSTSYRSLSLPWLLVFLHVISRVPTLGLKDLESNSLFLEGGKSSVLPLVSDLAREVGSSLIQPR